MSTLDKIINRAKRGSVDDEDTNYVTVVDRPPSYQKNTIPSRYTNDFERIYQVVKSSYNCGQVQYNYDACIYDNLVQNYVQKGVADVSSMKGYNNVSLQDLPLACNIPSVVYNNCSPPTNMLTTEVTVNEQAGFRLNMNGLYLYPADTTITVLTFIDRNSLQIRTATFVLEKKSINELDILITQDKPYYEKYIQYKEAYAAKNTNGFFLNNFYYIKHVASGKYLVPSYTAKYTRASIINFTYISQPSFYVIRIYDQNLDEIFSYDFDTNISFNRTGIYDIRITRRNSQGYVDIEFYNTSISIGDVKISAKNSPNNFYSFSVRLFSIFNKINPLLNTNTVVTTIQDYINSLPSSSQFQDIGVILGELNPYYCKVLGEYYLGKKFEDSNTYPILFPFTIDDIYMLTNNNTQLNLIKWRFLYKWWVNNTEGYIGDTIPFFIEKNDILMLNLLQDFSKLSYYFNKFKLLSSNNTKNIIIYTHNFDTVYGLGTSPVNWFYLSINYGLTFSTITLEKDIQIIDLSKDGKYAIIAFTDNSVVNYNLSNLTLTILGTFNYDNTVKPYSICQSYDGNVIYLCFDNKKLWRCFNRTYWAQLSDIPFNLSKDLRNYYLANVNFMDTNQTGKNMMYKSYSNGVFMISRNYGSKFDMIVSPFDKIFVPTNIKVFENDFYITQLNKFYRLNSNNNFQLLFTDLSSWNSFLYIMNITNTYVLFIADSPLQFSVYLLNKKLNNLSRIKLSNVLNGDYTYFINENLSSIIVSGDKIIKYNTNIPPSMQDTPYVLNNGLCYPSYSFTASTKSNQGVKNVFNDDTYVLSTDTTIIKKISNNLSITSSSILRENTSILSITGSITDIACSNNGQVIIASVYNGKLLLWDNINSRFTEYNEISNIQNNKNIITNIIRYWTSVTCSFSGKYMSACAYNGNIFISTNSGTLFTSSPENFAKKWVQIVMNKSSVDTKDGIIQLACAEDGLFISYDRGANWSQINNEVIDSALGTNLKWSSVAISDSGQYMLATVYGGYVYASYNYGYDWSIYGVSRKECYEPVIFPTNNITLPYLNYNLMASNTTSGNIINAFIDDNSTWSSTTINTSVIITLPYRFLLTDINIVNLTSVDVKIKVEGSNDGSWNNTPVLGENLNLYSTVNTNTSYKSFRITFLSSNIQIQRIKLLGKPDFVSDGVMSQIGNWKSCAIVSETQHYAAIDSGVNAGLYKSVISSSFGNVIKIFSSFNATITLYDKQNNIIVPNSSNFTNNVYILQFNSKYDFGRVETNISSNGSVSIENDGIEVFRRNNVSLGRVFFWF